MLKKFIVFIALSLSLLAQSGGTGVVTTDGPPRDWHTKVYTNTSGALYICYTKQDSQQTTLTSITPSSTSTTTTLTFGSAHGFSLRSYPSITLSGMTGSWAALNGVHRATVVSSTVITVPINSSGFGAVTGTLSAVTKAARLTQPIWGVKVLFTSISSGLPEFEGWAINGFSNVCTDPTTLSYQ